MSQRARITRRIVETARPQARRVTIADTELAGFCLRIEPAGVKTFFVRYRADGGGRKAPQRFMSIGRFPALSVDEARRKARTLLGAVARGDDPGGSRTAARREMTVSELCDLYFRDGVLLPTRRGTLKKPGSIAFDRGAIDNHVKPLLGNRRMSNVSRSDIARLLADIASGKTAAPPGNAPRRGARARGGPGAATRTATTLSAVFAFAVRRDLLTNNPVHGVPKYASRSRERFLRMEELERFGAALREGETVGIAWEPDPATKTKHAPKPENRRVLIDPSAAAALRLLLFTGARRNEILTLRWDYVDVERGLLFLPDSKTGRKTIILNGPALAVLADLPKDGPFVIAGRDADTHRVDLKKPWDAICRRAGLEGLRLHDLRHTHASFGVCAGFGLPIVGKLLGHTTPQTTARYAHLDIDPVRIASERIGGVLARALAPAPPLPEPPRSPSPAGNVVPFRRAAS